MVPLRPETVDETPPPPPQLVADVLPVPTYLTPHRNPSIVPDTPVDGEPGGSRGWSRLHTPRHPRCTLEEVVIVGGQVSFLGAGEIVG